MSSNNWNSLELNNLIPTDALDAMSSVTSLIKQYISIADVGISTAKMYAHLMSLDATDILGTLVTTIKDAIEGLLQAGKIHALFVPIPKRFPEDPSMNRSAFPATLADLVYSLGYDAGAVSQVFTPESEKVFQALRANQAGGNGAFYNTIVSSLYDAQDLDRPQYLHSTDWVAASVFMIGAPSLATILDAATAFSSIFRPTTSFASRIVPIPQNVRTSVISVPNATRMGVQIEWDAPKVTFNTPYFPTSNMAVHRYAVIRTTLKTAPNAKNILDFFTARELSQGLMSGPNGETTVIAVGTGLNSVCIDDSALDNTKTYYYCVAWEVEVTENGKRTVLPWDLVSSVRKVTMRRLPPNTKGTPPDWKSYGSLIDVVPNFSTVIKGMLAQVATVGERAPGGAASAALDGLDTLQKNLATLSSKLDLVLSKMDQLRAAFKSPIPSIYETHFHGVGGNSYFLSELAARLGDTSDTSRPPFDSNEYVIGVVLLVGGLRLPDIQPYLNMQNLIFSPAASSGPDPVYTALDQIDALVTLQEQRVFGQDLVHPILTPDGQPLDPSAPLGTVLNPRTIDPLTGLTLPGIDPMTGLPAVPAPLPVIGEDGTPQLSSSPSNPSAGFTNARGTTLAAPDGADVTTTRDVTEVSTDPSPGDTHHTYVPR